MNGTEHDNLLFSMLQECKTLPVFLDHIFGFLRRRTDFYVEVEDPNSSIGLPPNLAEQLVRNTFYKYKTMEPRIEDDIPPPVIEEVEIETETVANEEPLPSEPQKALNDPKESTDFTSAECYNGQAFEKYSWSQTLQEIDIFIKIPDKTTTKDLLINILPDKLSVKHKDGTVLLEGELCDKCKNLDVIWSINKNKLEIHLDKAREYWWNCLIKSENKLDLNKVDCSRPYEELSDEAQAKIEELQWNEHRKRLGLPTTEEMKMHDLLKKSWNAEGSPFSGPFDPSAVKFQ